MYFGLLWFYAGTETSGIWIWIGLGCVFLALAWFVWFYRHHKKQIPLWLPVSLTTFGAACFAVFVVTEILIFSGMVGTNPVRLDYLIVLGARVKENDLSKSLKSRLDKAIRYVEEYPDTLLVLSGGQGSDEPVSEAMAMAAYLRYNGVKPEQMLLEINSTNTAENLIYSKALIDQREQERKQSLNVPQEMIKSAVLVVDKPLEIGVLSNNFHLYRATRIGHKQGFENLHGIAAGSDRIMFIHFCVRESLAILKDKFMGNM